MTKLVKASKVTFKLFNQVDQKDELEMEGLFDRADKAVKKARKELPSGTNEDIEARAVEIMFEQDANANGSLRGDEQDAVKEKA